MDARSAFDRKGEVVFLDVREPYEFDAGHIDGSMHIPLAQLPGRTNELPSDRTIVVVCQIGQRSDLAAQYLREKGYAAHNLEGGLTVWQSLGLPCATDAGQEPDVVDGFARDFNGLLSEGPDA